MFPRPPLIVTIPPTDNEATNIYVRDIGPSPCTGACYGNTLSPGLGEILQKGCKNFRRWFMPSPSMGEVSRGSEMWVRNEISSVEDECAASMGALMHA